MKKYEPYPRTLRDRLENWWFIKFVEDAGVYEELDYARIRSWKIILCRIVGHVEFDVEVGEHWESSNSIASDYALVCGRCGRWL